VFSVQRSGDYQANETLNVSPAEQVEEINGETLVRQKCDGLAVVREPVCVHRTGRPMDSTGRIIPPEL